MKNIMDNFKLLIRLSKNDLKSKYAGSFFGIIWSFVQPLVTIGVFYVVFQVGFRNPPVQDIEFVLWISPGYLVWTYFQDMVLGSANSLSEYGYLVKKIKFDTKLIPLVKILSSTFIHLIFILIIYGLYMLFGYSPQIMWIQVFYYCFCATALATGLAFLCASVTVFFKDFAQIVGVIFQLLFWATPIFWNVASVSEGFAKILKLNPVYYIVEGYRDCLISGVAFWSHSNTTIYFWSVTLVTLFAGIFIFKKLQQHFADVI